MKTLVFCSSLVCFCAFGSFAQNCGFELFEQAVVRDPELTSIKDSVHTDLYNWLKTDSRSRLYDQRIENPYSYLKDNSSGNRSLCGYDNSYIGWGDAPTTIGGTLTAADLDGGDYFTVNNLLANRTYRISTCGQNDFDTQITVYPQGGGGAVAHNDDACANNQSEILFCPTISGNYDILLDEWNCDWTILVNTDVTVELIYQNRPVYTVPVVFHVVYNTPEENVTDAEIYDQLDILNEHFRRQNAGLYQVPAAFRGQSSDPLIEFCLAQQNPYGNATSGITRTYTSVDYFPQNNGFYCQPSPPICLFDPTAGGTAPWDKNNYVNIWIGDLEPGKCGIGYSAHPLIGYGFSPQYQGVGVAIDYECFGALSGNQSPGRDEGRTLVHEMGHYFGLWHLWGADDNELCASDSVVDTPPQSEPHFGIPSFPEVDDPCVSIYPGTMFHNYMDYSNDEVTNMFTYKQAAVFDYALFNWYQSLIDSEGCQPGLTTSIDEPVIEANNNALLTSGGIELTEELSRIEIYDLFGRLIMTSSEVSKIDLSAMPKGFYIMRTYNRNKLAGVQRVVLR